MIDINDLKNTDMTHKKVDEDKQLLNQNNLSFSYEKEDSRSPFTSNGVIMEEISTSSSGKEWKEKNEALNKKIEINFSNNINSHSNLIHFPLISNINSQNEDLNIEEMRKSSIDSKENTIYAKSAFMRVNSSENSMEYMSNQYKLPEFNCMNINSFHRNQIYFYNNDALSSSSVKKSFNESYFKNKYNCQKIFSQYNIKSMSSKNFNQNNQSKQLFASSKNEFNQKQNEFANFNIIRNENKFPNFSGGRNFTLKSNLLSSKEVQKNPQATLNSSVKTANETYLGMLISAAHSIIEKGYKFPEEITYTFDNCDEQILMNKNNYLYKEDCTSSMLRKCENKTCAVFGPKNSDLWFKCRNSKSKPLWLCACCHKAWKNNQFCYYCNVIYRENTGSSNCTDTKSWICCDYCEMWQHIQCEETKGFYGEINELNKDPNFKYMCPLCRKKSFHIKNSYDSYLTNRGGKNSKRQYNLKKNSCRNLELLNPNMFSQNLLAKKCKNDNFDYNVKFSKKIDFKLNTIVNINALPNKSVLNSNDNRDIFLDCYKISNINSEEKNKC